MTLSMASQLSDDKGFHDASFVRLKTPSAPVDHSSGVHTQTWFATLQSSWTEVCQGSIQWWRALVPSDQARSGQPSGKSSIHEPWSSPFPGPQCIGHPPFLATQVGSFHLCSRQKHESLRGPDWACRISAWRAICWQWPRCTLWMCQAPLRLS